MFLSFALNLLIYGLVCKTLHMHFPCIKRVGVLDLQLLSVSGPFP